MAKKILTDKHRLIAYVLNNEMGYTQKKISELMSVSQGTISGAVKDARYMKQIRGLEKELQAAREEIANLGYSVKAIEILPPAEEEG